MILKLGMKHQGMELYKVYVNHDPGMTLTYFMARSTQVAYPRSQVSVYRTIRPMVYNRDNKSLQNCYVTYVLKSFGLHQSGSSRSSRNI